MEQIEVRILKSGEYFGEVALLREDKKRTLSAKAVIDSFVISIPQSSFMAVSHKIKRKDYLNQ